MKIIKDKKGYTTSIILLVMLIPLLLLLIITIQQYDHEVDTTVENLETQKIKSKTTDFEEQIITKTKESLHEITLETVTKNRPYTNSRETLKKHIQNKTNHLQEEYLQDDIIINCTINSIKSSDDPFKIELDYTLHVTAKNTTMQISKNQKKLVEITDTQYPVYDPLPTLKTGARFTDNTVEYTDKLSQIISIEGSDAYLDTIQQVTINKCPYNDYSQHGNDNKTIQHCLNNHYYHNSHDGMCLLCRLENKTSCNDYGFETFIHPTKITDRAPASIDHVLLNDQNNQYMGNNISIANNTTLYLDNGHKTKYGF